MLSSFGHIKWNEGKTFEHFLTEIRSSSESCNFGINKDRMLRDKIVFTVSRSLRQVLLRENPLTLNRAIQICRSFDASHVQSNQMCSNASFADNVNKVDFKRRQVFRS